MVSSRRAVQGVVTSGLLFGTALTCLAQSGAPVQERPATVGPGTVQEQPATVGPGTGTPVQEQPSTAGPKTSEQLSQERAAKDRAGDRVVTEERVVERRREGEVYVAGYGGFTWGHNFSGVDGRGTLAGQQF